MNQRPTGPNSLGLSSTWRSVVSLLLLIHLFAVVVSLLSNESISALRHRLTTVLAPYTRLLNIDPGFTAGYHLTHAMEYEDDHQLLIELDGQDDPLLFPSPRADRIELGPGFSEHRWRWLTRRAGILAIDGNDDALAELARAIGEALFAKSEARHFVMTCRRLRPAELQQDTIPSLDDDSTYEVLYRADVLLDGQGAVRIHKRVEAGEAAPVYGS